MTADTRTPTPAPDASAAAAVANDGFAQDYDRELIARFTERRYHKLALAYRTPITARLERLLYEVIEAVDPGFFIEVGAFEAKFSTDMAARHPNLPVLAAEANPRVHAEFAERLARTGVDYRHVAVSSRAGRLRFNIPEVVKGTDMPRVGRMGSLRELSIPDSRSETVEVDALTLDELAADVPGADGCLWIDVEGAADQVIAAGARTLARTAIVYVELETNPVWTGQALAPDVRRSLIERGFRELARDCQKAFQYNALMVQADLTDDPGLRALSARYFADARLLFDEAEASMQG